MDKLKPCPFCGGEANLEEEVDIYSVGCFTSGCFGCLPTHFDWGYKTEEEAIEAWNRRHHD